MEQRFVKIEGEPSYVKDMASTALINTDVAALAEYRQKKKQNNQMAAMQQEINMLRDEIAKIKTHLKIS
jgi:cell division protein FtsB